MIILEAVSTMVISLHLLDGYILSECSSMIWKLLRDAVVAVQINLVRVESTHHTDQQNHLF